jgi:type I restriction enzyme S subunit
MRMIMSKIYFSNKEGKKYKPWSHSRIDAISTFSMGFTPDTKNISLWSGPNQWLSIAGMKKKYIDSGNKFISNDAVTKKKIFSEGTLIMSFKLSIGKLAILKKDLYTNEAICGFSFNDNISTEFMFYALSYINIASFGSRAVKGITLNSENIGSIVVPVPELEEQKKIANFLSALDDRIELQDKKVQLLTEQKKGYSQKIFSRELVFQDDNGNSYGEWENVRIDKAATFSMGFTPDTKNISYWSGKNEWLSIAGMKNKYITKGNKHISNEAIHKKAPFAKGSLIMSFKLSIGKLAILKEDLFTNEAICAFEFDYEKNNIEFMYYTLSNINIASFGSRAVKGITLNSENIGSIVIPVPEKEEQEKIGNFLSALDEQIDLEKQKLELFKQQKQGYMQRIFA